MEFMWAVLVGALTASGVYLMTSCDRVRFVFGIALLGHAANLMVFLMGGLTIGRPPLASLAADSGFAGVADPLPQALVLTAIVIGFAIQAFALILVWRLERAENEGEAGES